MRERYRCNPSVLHPGTIGLAHPARSNSVLTGAQQMYVARTTTRLVTSPPSRPGAVLDGLSRPFRSCFGRVSSRLPQSDQPRMKGAFPKTPGRRPSSVENAPHDRTLLGSNLPILSCLPNINANMFVSTGISLVKMHFSTIEKCRRAPAWRERRVPSARFLPRPQSG